MNITASSKNRLGMPVVGFGTYQLSNEQAESCVREALMAGFRHIDSAEGYRNEAATGNGIKAAGISRDECFITTKLFPGFKAWNVPEKDYAATIETLKRQLTELQLDYVDLYLIHAPFSELRLEQWSACLELKKQGLAKHIGVANYNQARIQEIIDAGMPIPETNQIEFHPLCAQPELTKWMREKSIAPVAYSSLAPLSTWRTEKGQGGDVLAEIKAEAQAVIDDITNELGVSGAKLMLRWGIQSGYCVLTKSSKPERIQSNLDLFDFAISDSQMDRLNRLNKNQAIAWAANGVNPMDVFTPLKSS